MKKVAQLICSCDKCGKTLGDNFQDIKNKGHYVSTIKLSNGLPKDLICKDCSKKYSVLKNMY